MVKQTLIALGLGLALTGGATTAAHASSHVAAHHVAARHAIARHAAAPGPTNTTTPGTPGPTDTTTPGAPGAETGGDMAADPDATAPCAVDASGNETGNCQDSQNASGPQDNSGGADGPETAGDQANQ